MRELRLAFLALAACLTLACSDGDDGTSQAQSTGGATSSDGGAPGTGGASGSGQDVSGAWCGKQVSAASDCVGDEVTYLELVQEGTTVSGQYCEAFGHDCYQLTGSVEGTQLTFEYGFSGYTVTGTFEIGATLNGKFFSTKCDCEIPVEVFSIN